MFDVQQRFTFETMEPDMFGDDEYRAVCAHCGWTSMVRPTIPDALYLGNKHWNGAHHDA